MTSPRLSRALLGSAALIGLGVSTANATLLIDVRASTRNGVSVADPKNVAVAVGDTLVFRVFADVTGTNDARPDCIQDLSGSFLSTGGIKGNLALSFSGFAQPFTANATSAGQQTDLDGDGDLDLGSNNDPVAAGYVALRSNRMTGPRSTNPDGSTVFSPGAGPSAIAHGTEYRLISTLSMVVSSTGSSTVVNFRRRLGGSPVFWVEDATEVVTDNGNGTTAYSYIEGTQFTDESSVLTSGVTLSVPEPATIGLASIAGLGLLARRRR